MAEPNKVHIIGIGDDGLAGLTAANRRLLEQADLVIGSEPALASISDLGKERMEIRGDLEQLTQTLQERSDQQLVILASGDPMFYGTARYLCDRLGKDRFEVAPHVSSMQLAFARVKESWDEAYLTDLSSQALSQVVEKVRTAERVGLFTSSTASPADVAKALLERRIDYFTVYVCENLGSPDERVTHAELSEIAQQQFSPLNVMILTRKPGAPDRPPEMRGRRLFGNPDEMFLQSQPKRGLLTPSEVRVIALAELDIGPSSTVWDIGAGSGSVAVEAAQVAAAGRVYAIEMDVEDYQLIAENAERFGVKNLTPVLGKAPEAWKDLPAPNAIFVGGTGRTIDQIVEDAFQALLPGGRLVANVGSIDNVAAVRAVLRKLECEVNVLMINIARGVEQLERMRFESLNPTFLLTASKPE
ncbi:precorrin-6y C5,15-methyltransferase (decarboxylating) subunit CbiE [Lignipirellula cremea]|uniref:Precorrin-6Y C(5,15)-methyltransferase [decarboxylating] n=1 Tax=Lignipirellula cremea TaxID=2528010 RepID=A0A518DTV4_9BACT|nr:precorrin-6y C5,15-methyltransferase (decarboxylating) subunit CbiE [Lignipirellula cremea]QDU95259.1 Precorrin-6Y C(5,15)-methyltransferase [decarboxylating] [Lignipirellula cremea]